MIIISPSTTGVVVDARVLRRLKLDKYGQQSWLLSALHVYCGREQLKGSKVVVKTPAIKNGGVMLQEDCDYRLHVMDVGKFFLNKPSGFFFWRGTVIKLGSAKKNMSALESLGILPRNSCDYREDRMLFDCVSTAV